MSNLLKRYLFAGILKVGSGFRYVDEICTDFVLARTVNVSFADVRFARAHQFDVTDPVELQLMRAEQRRQERARTHPQNPASVL